MAAARAYPELVKAQPKAAGLAVRAKDTGRILMLQRSIADEKDRARGKWEFPGGCVNPGEAPLQGAVREWQEETGVPLPAGDLAGSWTSPDGVYVGHIYVIPSEADVKLNADADERLIGNPDDPDGDDCETLAWWAPSEAAANPALRDEAKIGTDWQQIGAAVPDATFKAAAHPMGPLGLEWAEYRAATDPKKSCGTCGFFRGGVCSMFDAAVEADHTCDQWTERPVFKARVYPRLVKEQPTAEGVHIDGATWSKKKRKRSDEPETAREIPDADELDIKVVKADQAKQLVYGIVLEPHRVDSQGDWEDHADIEKAAHRYLGQTFQHGVTDLVNLQHRWEAPGVFPVESYVAPADFTLNGEPVAKGSWVLVMKVADPDTWQEVLDGHWGGFSVEGTGRRDHSRPRPPESVSVARR